MVLSASSSACWTETSASESGLGWVCERWWPGPMSAAACHHGCQLGALLTQSVVAAAVLCADTGFAWPLVVPAAGLRPRRR